MCPRATCGTKVRRALVTPKTTNTDLNPVNVAEPDPCQRQTSASDISPAKYDTPYRAMRMHLGYSGALSPYIVVWNQLEKTAVDPGVFY